jgi:hypothetical protein
MSPRPAYRALPTLETLNSRLAPTTGLDYALALGSTGNERACSVDFDATGNAYVVGFFDGSIDLDPGPGTTSFTTAGDRDVFVAKYSPAGTLAWAKQIGGPGSEKLGNTDITSPHSVVIDPAGDVYLVGTFGGVLDADPGPGTALLNQVGGANDLFVVKLTGGGEFLWARSMGGAHNTFGTSLAADAGGVYLTGFFEAGNTDFDPGPGSAVLSANGREAYLVKLTSSGQFAWASAFGGGGADEAHDVVVDPTGDVILTGRFNGGGAGYSVDFDPGLGAFPLTTAGGEDTFIVKLSGSGGFVWARSIGGGGHEVGVAAAVDPAGNVVINGRVGPSVLDFDPGPGNQSINPSGPLDSFVLKLTSVGDFSWARRWGGTEGLDTGGIAVDGRGDIYSIGVFTGTCDFDPGPESVSLTSQGGADVWVQHLGGDGSYIQAFRWGGDQNDRGNGIVADATGRVYVAGEFQGSVDFDPGPGVVVRTAVADTDAYVLRLGEGSPPLLTGVPLTGDIAEGQEWTFTASATDPDAGQPLTFQMDGAPTGAVIDAETGVFTWTPSEGQGPAFYGFRVQVTDGDFVAESVVYAWVREVNVAPILPAIPAPATTVRGGTVIFTAAAMDGDLVGGLGNTLTYPLVNAPTGASIDPDTGAFRWMPGGDVDAGTYPITVRVTDDGVPAASHTTTVAVTVADVTLTAGGDLMISGTAGNDKLTVNPSKDKLGLVVTLNGDVLGTYPVIDVTGRIVAYGLGGNDKLSLNPKVAVGADLDGGSGNDSLTGGAGSDLLVGGAGKDTLAGGLGANVLTGGAGADKLTGGTGDDLLIGGATAFDFDPIGLAAIRAEWASATPYADRVAHLKTGGGLNGTTVLGPATVTDDAKDKLAGGKGLDWFVAGTGDGLDLKVGEEKLTI